MFRLQKLFFFLLTFIPSEDKQRSNANILEKHALYFRYFLKYRLVWHKATILAYTLRTEMNASQASDKTSYLNVVKKKIWTLGCGIWHTWAISRFDRIFLEKSLTSPYRMCNPRWKVQDSGNPIPNKFLKWRYILSCIPC